MADWPPYALADFLLFSERTYLRLFELHNGKFWPLQVLTVAAASAAAVLLLRDHRHAGRVVSAVLAAAWALVALIFFGQSFATINWASSYLVPVALGQAALLATLGVWANCLAPPAAVGDRRSIWGGVGIAVIGLAGYPILAMASDRGLAGAEVFALTPDATVVVTAGLVAMARPARVFWILLAIPAALALISLALHHSMGRWEGWIPVIAVGVAACAYMIPSRPPTKRSPNL